MGFPLVLARLLIGAAEAAPWLLAALILAVLLHAAFKRYRFGMAWIAGLWLAFVSIAPMVWWHFVVATY